MFNIIQNNFHTINEICYFVLIILFNFVKRRIAKTFKRAIDSNWIVFGEKIKEQKLRKFQNTNITEDKAGPTLPAAESYMMPEPGKPENGTATDNNSEVPADTLVSTVPKRTGNKKAPVQFSKFYGFKPGTIGR